MKIAGLSQCLKIAKIENRQGDEKMIGNTVSPRCSAMQMAKVIRRASPIPEKEFMPEHNLVFAIINQAVQDLVDKNKVNRVDAHVFLHGAMFDKYCNMAQVNPDYVRKLLSEGGFVVSAAIDA